MKYKITELLKTFSQEDIKNFRTFLLSPYFNESPKLSKLYEALIQHHPLFDSRQLTEENLSHKLNPKLTFKLSTMKVLFFDLAKKAEEYLKILNFQNRHVEGDDFLRNELFKRGQHKFIDQNTERNSIVLDKEENIDLGYFVRRFQLVTDVLNSNLISQPRSNSKVINSNIRLMSERGKYITYFFITEMVRMFDNLLNLKRTFVIDDQKNFIIRIFREIDFESLLRFVILSTDNKKYSRILQLNVLLIRLTLESHDQSCYLRYKDFLKKNLKYLGRDVSRFHFTQLMRYCMDKISERKNSQKYETELFNIYKYILSHGYYKTSVADYFPIELYRTILIRGLEMKKYKWTLEFIKKYCPKLRPDRKDNMYSYSIAKYYFHKKKFDSAMRNFHEIHLNHFILKVDLKDMMLMTYYELGLYDNALSLIETYRRFLSNTKILSLDEKKRCRNFFCVIQKMIQYKYSFNPSIKYLVKKGLQNEMTNRIWLEEKFAELDSRYVQSA
ncbi:MAG: hypothetical protein ABI462_08565 [Ignavibacteria bacterium]